MCVCACVRACVCVRHGVKYFEMYLNTNMTLEGFKYNYKYSSMQKHLNTNPLENIKNTSFSVYITLYVKEKQVIYIETSSL